jgi:dipeptidyl aminopeptidase/acylaminoacyl peptidase
LWDVATGKKLRQLQAGRVSAIAFAPDGKTLATESVRRDGPALRLWDVAAGEEVRALPGHEAIDFIAFSPDGKLLAAAGWRRGVEVQLWDVASGAAVRALAGAPEVYYLAFSPDGRWLAAAGGDRDKFVHIWEVLTGKEVRLFRGHHTGILTVAFAPDGRTIASGGSDSTVLIWDVTGRLKDGHLRPAALTSQALEARWRDLAGDEGPRAAQAVWDLAAGPRDAVPFLRRKLPPAEAFPAEQMAPLIRDLDSDKFEVRKKAGEELRAVAHRAEPALRKELTRNLPLEVRQRIEQVLAAAEPSVSPERLREMRAVQALEYAGTPEAKEWLRKLAGGAEGVRLTREARAAVGRLAK